MFSTDSTSGQKNSEHVRIEDLANIKISEKQKKPPQPYLTSNDIPSVGEKTKPIKVFSKLITKHDKQQEQVNHKHASYSNQKIQVRAENENEIVGGTQFEQDTSNLQRTNGHTGQSKTSLAYFMSAGLRSFPSSFKSTTFEDVLKSPTATFEAAGPYTTRVNFAGPLFHSSIAQKTLVQPQTQPQPPKSFYYRTEVQVQPQTRMYQAPLVYSRPAYNVPYHFPSMYFNQQHPFQMYPQMNHGFFK